MRIRDSRNDYGPATRALHWGSALLILLAWGLGTLMEDFPRAMEGQAKSLHFGLGVVVLSLAALRVLWRLVNPHPAPPPGTPSWQDRAGRLAHLALYGLTLAVPLSGLFDRWARGRPVGLPGGLVLPAPFAVPGGKLWGEVHEVAANLLLVLVGLHVAAALWHHLVLRDNVLRRMTGRGAAQA